jgi:hypothetical protein
VAAEKEDRLGMYEKPTREDLLRNIDLQVLHKSRRRALEERGRVQDEFTRAGAFDSTRRLVVTADAVDKVHQEYMAEAVKILHEFAQAGTGTSQELSAWTRPHLDVMNGNLLGVVDAPPTSFKTIREQLAAQYRAVFQQRLDATLRDFEVGFAGGRNVRPPAPATPPAAQPLWIWRLTFWGSGINLEEAWRRFKGRRLRR